MKKNEALTLLQKVYQDGKISGSWIICGKETDKRGLISDFCHSVLSEKDCLSEVKWIQPDLIKKEKDDLIKQIKNGQEIDENKKRKRNAFITVEDIRKGIEFMALKSLTNQNRFLIIDTADLMNIPAQNCLLKMLEEPGDKGVVFLLADYPEKLLSTITSRCRKIRLFPHSQSEILNFIIQNYPQYDSEVLLKLSFSNIEKIKKIIEFNGVDIYQKMIALKNRSEIYAFVEKNIKDEENLQMIIDFSFVILSEKIEKNMDNSDITLLLLDIWEKLQNLLKDMDRIYLDKKQVLALILEDVLL